MCGGVVCDAVKCGVMRYTKEGRKTKEDRQTDTPTVTSPVCATYHCTKSKAKQSKTTEARLG